MPEPLRIMLAEDHPLFRRGMRTMLGAVPDFALVGEAENGRQAIELAVDLLPDIVLMDLQLPDISGIAATREILAASPNTKILVVTLFEDDDSVFLALRAGARLCFERHRRGRDDPGNPGGRERRGDLQPPDRDASARLFRRAEGSPAQGIPCANRA